MADTPIQRDDGIPIFHDYLNYRRNPLEFWRQTSELAPIVKVRFGPKIAYWVVTDPDFLQQILQGRAKYYPRERRLMKLNRRDGPELLFNTDKWEEWLWRRRLMQPAFHRKQIAGFAETMVAETERLLASWPSNEEILLEPMMKRLTMRIIGRTMFSVDVDADIAKMQESFEADNRYIFKRASAMWAPPLWLPLPSNLAMKKATTVRMEILANIVQQRYESGEPQGDLLDTLIAARLEEDGRSLTAEQLVWEMSGIVFAGHETTALTQTWLFYLLSQHPEVEARLRAEIDAVLGKRPITLADLEQMPYTDQVIQETMRMYPPVYVTIREADEDDQFGPYHIPKGTSLLINIRGMHYDRRHWQEPNRFDPERFRPQRAATRHKFAYLPFIHGPRKCMGDSFAMMEMRLIVPTILQRYRLRYRQPEPPQEKASFVMETGDQLPMWVERRQ